MADHTGDSKSLTEKAAEKHRDGESSSSSGSDDDKPSAVESLKKKSGRLFGRQKTIHEVLGGGKPADIILWRKKKTSAISFGVGTAVWFLFECLEYNLITLISHILITSLATIFLWSNASVFINKTPPKIPEVTVPEKCVLEAASALRTEVNRALVVLRNIATGTDVKKFIGAMTGLWVFSVVGNCSNFLTLFYIFFVLMFTVPLLYEKHEDQVDLCAQKAIIEIKKQYAIFDAKVLSQIRTGALNKKLD